jgi:hypothetical protein
MNLKNLTIAVIIGLFYEILLHICAIFFNIVSIHRITSLLSFLFGLVILAFFIAFYKEERSNKNIKLVLEILIGFFVISLILMLPITHNMNNLKFLRLLEMIVRLINIVLFFTLLISISNIIKSDNKLFHQAVTVLTFMLGINIFTHLFSIITYIRFIISGVTFNSSIFINSVLALFLVTHLSMIYFLYRYYKNNLIINNKR